MTGFTDTTLVQMRHVSTATLTTQMFKRGFRNVFMQGVLPVALAAVGTRMRQRA